MDDLFPEELCVAKVHRTGADQTTNCNPEIRSRLYVATRVGLLGPMNWSVTFSVVYYNII